MASPNRPSRKAHRWRQGSSARSRQSRRTLPKSPRQICSPPDHDHHEPGQPEQRSRRTGAQRTAADQSFDAGGASAGEAERQTRRLPGEDDVGDAGDDLADPVGDADDAGAVPVGIHHRLGEQPEGVGGEAEGQRGERAAPHRLGDEQPQHPFAAGEHAAGLQRDPGGQGADGEIDDRFGDDADAGQTFDPGGRGTHPAWSAPAARRRRAPRTRRGR